MGIAQRARNSFRSMWSHGEEEEFEREEPEAAPEPYQSEPQRYDSPEKPRATPSAGGPSVRRVPDAVPLRVSVSREKQIYTIKPHGLEEASAAADFLKLGSAVVVSLDDVDRATAVRIIDFMSGVCYGLDAQGHAMKLGDTIFLFTPGDFEITSDEPDYNENQDFFFRDIPNSTAIEPSATPSAAPPPAGTSAASASTEPSAPSAGASAAGPIIERTVIGRTAPSDRVTVDSSASTSAFVPVRASIERPTAPPRPWER